MAIHRVTIRWTGFLGAPGYSNFYFMAGGGLISDAQSSVDRVMSSLGALGSALPGTVTLSAEPEVAELDESTGTITDFVNIDPPQSITGGGTSGYSAASGAVINWRTNDVRFNRRIRGRTFIVPLAGSAYQSDGTLVAGARENIQTAADGMVGGDLDSELVVWSRPRNGSGGVAATVVSANVPDMAAVLRSRRD